MPLGVGLAIGAVAGGAAGFFGGKSGAGQAPASANTGNLVDAATASQPPGAIQGASDATNQANIAAAKQRKKAAAGDTLLTPAPPPGGYKSGTPGAPVPATLIGSK